MIDDEYLADISKFQKEIISYTDLIANTEKEMLDLFKKISRYEESKTDLEQIAQDLQEEIDRTIYEIANIDKSKSPREKNAKSSKNPLP